MSSNFREMLAGIKAEISEVTVREVNDKLNGDSDFYVDRHPGKRRMG